MKQFSYGNTRNLMKYKMTEEEKRLKKQRINSHYLAYILELDKFGINGSDIIEAIKDIKVAGYNGQSNKT